jgi:hypothetical protein
MWPYWLMYLSLAVPALSTASYTNQNRKITFAFIGCLLAVFVGFRHQVGGDWLAYIRQFQFTQFLLFNDVILQSDPGYKFLNWAVAKLGFGIYALNLICASIFTWGLISFSRRQAEPWLALAVAFPYLVMVVAMGYTRQGVAIGLILVALNALGGRQLVKYLICIALATLFHKTALIMIPLGIFRWGRGWLFRAMAIFATAYVLFDLLVAKEAQDLWVNYVDAQMESQGAQIRVFMNLLPSLILLAFWRTWRKIFPDYWYWFWIAAGSVLAVLLVGVASTAVDRIALYFIPIQIAVFSRLPSLIRNRSNAKVIRFGIVFGYALVLFIWLNYATHARSWLPYQNLLFLF